MSPVEIKTQALRDAHPHAKNIIRHAEVYIKWRYPVLLVYQRDTETLEGIDKAKTPLPMFGPMHTCTDMPRFITLFHRLTLGSDRPIPFDNIGLGIATTGAITVLDDDHQGTTLHKLIEDGLLDQATYDAAPIVITRRGPHMYGKGGVQGRSGKFKGYPGLDIKGHNGYVLAPPTVVAGHTYKFKQKLVPAEDLPTLPTPLIEALSQARELGLREEDAISTNVADLHRARRVVYNMVATHDQIIESGNRNTCVYELAAAIGDLGVPETACCALLEREFFDYFEQPPDNPFSVDDMARHIANAYRYRQSATGHASVEAYFDEIEETEEPQKDDDGGFRDFSDAIAEPAPKWLIDELITVGSPVGIIGKSGHGKTNAALALCYALSVGMDFGPYKIQKPAKVAYVDMEGGAGTRQRMLALSDYHGITPPTGMFVYTDTQHYVTSAFDFVRLGKYLKRNRVDLVVIDTWARAIAGTDENKAQDMGLLVKRLDELRVYTGTAVMLVAHTPKSGQFTIRGSGAIDASLHTRIGVEQLSEPDAWPMEVSFTPLHVKDSYSGRAVRLINRVEEGVALVPHDYFAKVIAGDDVVEAAGVAYTVIKDSGPLTPKELIVWLQNDLGWSRQKGRDVVEKLHGIAFMNGTFQAVGTRTKKLRWISDAGRVDTLIG